MLNIQQFFITQENFADHPESEVGSLAKKRAKLLNYGFNLHKSLVIPVRTLKLIAQANNLSDKLNIIFHQHSSQINVDQTEIFKLNQKITELITNQTVPKNLAEAFIDIYHNYFNSSHLKVHINNKVNYHSHEVVGETSALVEVLKAWSKMLTTPIYGEIKATSISQLKEKVLGKLFLEPIYISQELITDSSGVTYTYDTRDGNKNRMTIYAQLGKYHEQLSQKHDTYVVDIRTLVPVKRQINDHAILSDFLLAQLVEKIIKIKRAFISQLKIKWSFHKGQFYLLDACECETEIHNLSSVLDHNSPSTSMSGQHNHSCNIKVYEAIKNLTKVDINQNNATHQYIGLSDLLLSSAGVHPLHLIKSSEKNFFVENASKILLKKINHNTTKLLYRFADLRSDEILKLEYANSYEIPELNPHLGFRGSLRLVSQPDIIKLELEIVKNLIKLCKEQHHIVPKIQLVIPFYRSIGEILQIQKIISSEEQQAEVWAELSNFANILTLNHGKHNFIKGYILNLKALLTEAYGLDPNNKDLTRRYHKDDTIEWEMVKLAHAQLLQGLGTTSIHEYPNFYLKTDGFNKELIDKIKELNAKNHSLQISGLIVNPEVTTLLKTCNIE